MNEYQARQLARILQTIPPGARLEITWTSHETDTPQTTTGVVTDHDPETDYRQLETDNKILELVPSGDTIPVQEPTPTTTHIRGELTDVSITEVPVLEAPLTEDGFKIPDPLVGLTGSVTVDLPTRNNIINLSDHGLQETDYRLIGNIGTDPEPDLLPDEPAVIRPETGPHYHVTITDERSNPGTHEYEPRADDQDLQCIRNTVSSLKEAAAVHTALPAGLESETNAHLVRSSLALQAAHRALCQSGTPPTPDSDPADEPAYAETVADLETDLEACMQTLHHDLEPDEWEPVEKHLREARIELRTLQQLLADADQQPPETPTDDHPDIPQWIIEPGAPAPVERGDLDD